MRMNFAGIKFCVTRNMKKRFLLVQTVGRVDGHRGVAYILDFVKDAKCTTVSFRKIFAVE